MKPVDVKKSLEKAIDALVQDPAPYLYHPDKDFTRNRKLCLKTVIEMLIGMGSGSLSKEIFEWFNYAADTVSVSAFVQQRSKIKYDALNFIFKTMVSQCDRHQMFNGYRLLAIDGSDLRLPTNKADTFSFIRNDENTKGYNLLHLDALYDLLQHVYVDASVQSKIGMNEHKALVTMIDRSDISDKVIIIADRGYESFNNIAHCQEKGWYYIIRSKESYGIKYTTPDTDTFDIDTIITLTRRQTKETKALIQKNPERYRWIQPHTTFDYIHSGKNKMYDLPIRIVRFKISDTLSETILTNLPRDDFSPQTIKELYKMRWKIETSFKELKYNIGLASIHSKKQNLILQEIYAKLTIYNALAMITYAQNVPSNKRINFARAVSVCIRFITGKISEDALLKMLSKFLSPVRPGRIFPRKGTIKNSLSFAYRFP